MTTVMHPSFENLQEESSETKKRSENDSPNKRVLSAYKNTKITDQKTFLHWLVDQLPDETKERV